MTPNVDFSGIFDTVLPNAYIKKVSISHKSLSDPGDARHYDEDQQYYLEKNQFGKKKYRPKDPEQFELVAAGKFLVVNAEIVIKDYIRDNNKPTWIENEELLNSMNLRVLLSTKQQITNNLRQRGLTEENIDRFKASHGLKEQIISLRKMNKKKIYSYRKEVVDGRTIYSASYEVTFKVYRPNPKHLAVFAGMFVDLSEYGRKKKVSTESSRRFLFGSFVGQVVLNAGSPVEQSNIFMLPNGKVWAGPVHYHRPSQTFMAGAFHTGNPHSALRQKKVPNKLLQDFRILDRAKTSKLLLKPYKARSTKRRPSKHRSQKHKKIMKSAYISEPEYSKDRNDNVHMSFHINFDKLIRERMRFGALGAKADRLAMKDLRELSEISSIKIYRNRVVKGAIRGQNDLANFENRTELIAEASTTTLSLGEPIVLTKPSNSYDEDAEKVQVGSIREAALNLGNAGIGVRTFTVSDLSMDRVTDGFYSYSVVLELIDGTKLFAENMLEKITQAKNLLIEYQGFATKPGNSDPDTGEYTKSFIDMLNKEYNIPSPRTVLGRTKAARQQIVRNSVANLPWNNAIASYVDVLGNITGLPSRDALDLADILYSIVRPDTGSVDGIQTTIEMINSLESQILRAMGTSGINESRPSNTAYLVTELDFNDKTRAYKGRLPTNIVSVQKRFKATLSSNTLRNVGYAYFNKFGSHKNAGHKQITNQELKTRFGKEHSKYFISSGLGANERLPSGINTGLNLNTNYFSFLTPSKVFLGPVMSLSLLDRGDSLYNYSQYDRLISIRLAMNPRIDSPSKKMAIKTDPFSPEFDLTPPLNLGAGYDPAKSNISEEAFFLSNTNSAILATTGIVTTSPTKLIEEEKISALTDGDNEDESGGIPVTEPLGPNTKFATEKTTIDDLNVEDVMVPDASEEFNSFQNLLIQRLIGSGRGLFSERDRPSIKKLSGPTNVVSKFFDSKENGDRLKATFFNEMPNQLKSLFLTDGPTVATNWLTKYDQNGLDIMRSESLSNFFYLNFEHVNRVEALVGFTRDDRGEPQVSSPVYRPLDRELINSTERRSRELLCRMTPYANEVLKTRKSEKLKMVEYESTFFTTPESLNFVGSDVLEQESQAAAEDFATPPSTLPIDGNNQSEVLSEGILSERLTEYSDLNALGRKALKSEILRTIQEGHIPPEFQSNLVVFQPKFVSRVGTNFAPRSNTQRQIVTDKSASRTALVRRARARKRPAREGTLDSPSTTQGSTKRGGGY